MYHQQPTTEQRSAASLHAQLRDLDFEAVAAREAGLTSDEAYMADLALEMATTEAAYVGAAVTEIAVFRAQLDAPLVG